MIFKFFHLHDLWNYTSLFKKLIYRDFFEKFAGSALAVVWTLINPLVLMGMYVLLFSVILKVRYASSGSHADFGLFLFCGMIPYTAFQEAILKASDCVLKHRALVLQVRFPKAFLPLHIAASAGIQQLIACFFFWLLVIFMQPYTPREPWHLLWLLPVQLIFTAGICQIIAAISVFFRDAAQLLNLVLMIGFFASPIVYPPSRVPPAYRDLWELNPFVHFIGAARSCLLGEGQIHESTIQTLILIALSSFLVGTLVFRRLSPRFYTVL